MQNEQIKSTKPINMQNNELVYVFVYTKINPINMIIVPKVGFYTNSKVYGASQWYERKISFILVQKWVK